MDLETIVKDTLDIVGLSDTDKPTNRSKVTYAQVLLALLSTRDLQHASKYLSISDDVLYKILSRHLSNVIPEKPYKVSWKQYILSINNLKECQQCKERLPLSSFVKNYETWDGLAYSCRNCKARFRKAFTEKNPEYARDHYTANAFLYKENAARYKAALLQASPSWADKEKILQIYKECPEGFHVDHIYPLQSDWVCGLHVEQNLRHIPAEENLSKGNRYIRELHY